MEIDPFPASDFDRWAATYDQDVLADTDFPFDGYPRALDTIVELARVQPGMRVLDLGTGTGNLAERFASLDCQLWCTDFSTQMLARARQKLPQARFVQADLRRTWPAELSGPFERIVSAYVFHHFPLAQKTALAGQLARFLSPGGFILVADIAFKDEESRNALRLKLGDDWEDEDYWIASESIPFFRNAGLAASFQQVSNYAGVFKIQPG